MHVPQPWKKVSPSPLDPQVRFNGNDFFNGPDTRDLTVLDEDVAISEQFTRFNVDDVDALEEHTLRVTRRANRNPKNADQDAQSHAA